MNADHYGTDQDVLSSFSEILPGLTWISILNTVSEMVGVLNTDAQCVWVNKAFADYAQKSQVECVGELCYDLLHLSQIKPYFSSANVSAIQNVYTNPSTLRKLQCSLSPIGLSGSANSGYILLASDVTEELMHEDDLQKAKEREMRARGRNQVFSTKLSCEFRTALTGIIGMTQFLKDTHLDYEQSDYIATLDSCSRSLMCLIDGLIDEGDVEAKIEQYPEFDGTVSAARLTSSDTRNMRCLAGKKILLVEDNLVNARVVSKMLESTGAVVDVAINGQIACESVASTQYDVVLMDCEMPVMDGYNATQWIRASGKTNLPIIALTAHASDEAQRLCTEVGMNAYLSKPIRKETLCNVVLQTLVTCLGKAVSS
ncbi:MAG: response regulator [Kiritimatiellaceae bacterium]|nr:response regulator [Kiritimatiellaceae bacterium]